MNIFLKFVLTIIVICYSNYVLAHNNHDDATKFSNPSEHNEINYIDKFLKSIGDSGFVPISRIAQDKRKEVFYKGTSCLHPSGVYILLTFDDADSEKIIRIDYSEANDIKFNPPIIIAHDYNYFQLQCKRLKLNFTREIDYKKFISMTLEKEETPSLLFEEIKTNGLVRLKNITLAKTYKEQDGTIRFWIRLNKNNTVTAASFGDDLGDNPEISALIMYVISNDNIRSPN